MAVSVVMPALEMAQETGKLLSWFKKEGETVVKGERLLEIETDKIVVELEAPADGVLAGIRSQEGAVVPVGQTIAWIVAEGERVPDEESDKAAPTARTVTASLPSLAASPWVSSDAEVRISPKARRLAEERGVDISKLSGTGPGGAISSDDVLSAAERPTAPATVTTAKISPKARRLAEERGVDISKLSGTGPGGTISSEDVLAAASAKTVVPQEDESLSAIARLMAERTTQSWTQVPHFFLVREVDATALLAAREKLGKSHTVTDLLIALTARALGKHPKMNGSWAGSGIRLNPDVNISLAVAVKDGVVGAVIHRADWMALPEIAAQRKDLADRARSGQLKAADITGGTFTISNLGMFGIDAFTAIITPPQAAILAVGRVADRVVAVDGNAVIRPMLTMTLSSDHRVVDGAQAAAFLKELAESIEAAEF